MGRTISRSYFIRNSVAKHWTVKGAIIGAALLVVWPGANAISESPSQLLIAQSGSSLGKGSRAKVQNIQRLLKLLSTRYPGKYASADPKRVDGVFGDDTAVAIKNFQKTSGITTPPRTNEALVSEILAALARMSALKPKQPQVAAAAAPKADPTPRPKAATGSVPKVSAPPVPKVTPPPVPKPETRKPPSASTKPDERPVPRDLAKPVTQPPAKPPVPKAAAPATAAAPVKTEPNLVTAPKAAPQKPTSAPKQVARTKPANDRLLYFVQVASLRDSQAARREWRRIRDSNRAALGAENVYFEKANIKERGVFYRILVGPVRDRETAVVLCSLLKRNGQKCVTTRRNLSAIKDPNAVIPSDPNKPDQRSRLADDKRLAEGVGVSPPEKPVASKSKPSKTPKTDTPVTDSRPASQSDQPAKTPQPSIAATVNSSEPSKADADAAKPPSPAAAINETNPKAGIQEKEDDDRKIAVAPLPAVPPAPAVKADLPTDADKIVKSPADTPEGTPAAVLPKPAETASIPVPPAMPKKSEAGSGAVSATSAPTRPAAATTPDKPTEETSGTDKSTSTTGTQDVAIARPAAPTSEPNAALPTDTKAKSPLINVNIQLDRWDMIAVPAGLALLLIAGVVVYGKRRRKQKSAFAQIFGNDDLSLDLGAHAAGTSETLGALEENFKSDPLRRARRIRDGFLHDVLDGELGEVTPDYSVESAMRINSELKHLLSAKPEDYKSIFLNWMFLSEVGTALHQKDILIDQLDTDIGRELTLLQNYFKIHLLELDDRHNLRENMPGIFYCLQLPPLRQRETAAISVA